MDEKKRPCPRGKRIMFGAAAVCMIIAIVSLVFALIPSAGKEDEISSRFAKNAAKAGELANATAETREAGLKELVSDYLMMSESSYDPVIQSAAYLKAGKLELWDYDEALKKSAEAAYLTRKPSRARLESAFQYLGKAVRICGEQKDRDSCFFREIQTNLDYARLLKGSKDGIGAGAGPNSQEKSAKQETEEARSSAKGAHAGREGEKNETGNVPALPMAGSVRGGHSNDLTDAQRRDDSSNGSGFEIPPNKP